jgi:voltage-gated potassium channel
MKRPLQTLVVRIGWSLGFVLLAWALLWMARHGLKDATGGTPNALDVLYFTVVTVTTLGYGDIVPTTAEARAIVTFGITPVRIAIWLILLSTAYELLLRRSIEQWEMKRLERSLKNHFVICGFGVKGQAAAQELLERGVKSGSIVVIDRETEALADASELGLSGIRGDAAHQRTLREAAIEKASHAIVVPDKDEACVLICLTIKDMAPEVEIIAAAREDENVRLIRNSGAKVVIAPSASGGRLLAGAAVSPQSARMLEELYEHGKGADIYDYVVQPEDVGKTAFELETMRGKLPLAVQSGGRTLRHQQARTYVLRAGDVVIVFDPEELGARPERKS